MVAELVADEAEVLHVYDDATGHAIVTGTTVVGHPTLGVGRALDRQGISMAESRFLLGNDLSRYVQELANFAWWTALDPVRKRAIMNMRHQLGLAGLLAFHDMIAALEKQDYATAATAGLDSQWAEETPARADRVMAQLRTGLSSDSAIANGAAVLAGAAHSEPA